LLGGNPAHLAQPAGRVRLLVLASVKGLDVEVYPLDIYLGGGIIGLLLVILLVILILKLLGVI
jgi:hypothetical protein